MSISGVIGDTPVRPFWFGTTNCLDSFIFPLKVKVVVIGTPHTQF
jgi:hypothetical protein